MTRPPDSVAIRADELRLAFDHGPGARALSFARAGLDHVVWREQARLKLAELLGLAAEPAFREVEILRTGRAGDVAISVVRMTIDDSLSIPAYLLVPDAVVHAEVVMALHGHGEAEAAIGLKEDYHHGFALALARAGWAVLCPELRGFGALKDLARDRDGARLDYWNWGGHMAYSLASESFLHGRPLIGQTVEDLLRWERWLCRHRGAEVVHVAGISYGGDLALLSPVFSGRTGRIFASGTLGSLAVIFGRCYNAPAHGIPGVLRWLDRSDMAGLNAPAPLAIHYGGLDVPGPDNHSASYNETVEPSFAETVAIYRAAGAPIEPRLIVSEGRKHEMDLPTLIAFLEGKEP